MQNVRPTFRVGCRAHLLASWPQIVSLRIYYRANGTLLRRVHGCVCARRPSPDQRPRHVCRAAAYATTAASARQPTRNMVPCFGLVAGLRLRSSRGERARCSGESEVGSARLARLGSDRQYPSPVRESERAGPSEPSRADPIYMSRQSMVHLYAASGRGQRGCVSEREREPTALCCGLQTLICERRSRHARVASSQATVDKEFHFQVCWRTVRGSQAS